MAEIPSIKLNEQELDNFQKTMRKGAANLKRLSEITGMEHRDLRARLFKAKFQAAQWPELDSDRLAVFTEALPAIKALRNIEWKLVTAFSRLAKKHAWTWAKKGNNSISDYEDFEQEAMVALLDAIYTYTQEDARFVTYAWWVIRNRMANFANKCNSFGALTNEAIRLLSRFDEVKCGFNRYVTDEEVFVTMGATEDEIATIKEAKVRCVSPSQLPKTDEKGIGDAGDDYTGERRGIEGERDTVPCHYEVREAMQRANLTPLERRIVETSLFPHYGWQTELAAETINPASGRPYTKARISQMLQIALEKIRVAYLKREVA